MTIPHFSFRLGLLCAALSAGGWAGADPGTDATDDPMSRMQHMHDMGAMHDMHDMHAHHHLPPMGSVVRTTAAYTLPDVELTRADGAAVRLRGELDDGRPVLLNFIYTTCTSVCPVMSRTFSAVQQQLGADAARVHMVSISIDPEHDTPARLQSYAQRFDAGPEWQLYTGSVQASEAVQKAFAAFRGDKMNHLPATFFRAAPDRPWVRFEGFATPEAIVREYRTQVAAQ